MGICFLNYLFGISCEQVKQMFLYYREKKAGYLKSKFMLAFLPERHSKFLHFLLLPSPELPTFRVTGQILKWILQVQYFRSSFYFCYELASSAILGHGMQMRITREQEWWTQGGTVTHSPVMQRNLMGTHGTGSLMGRWLHSSVCCVFIHVWCNESLVSFVAVFW